ncbi:hypothetical protein AAHA92_19546 [Salvia divinorum]|uniref:Uncharacterized protein n=1 Tax=Salvia divinorum TaxID=28513 RepID=A0ABD1H5Q3_SALDI
MDSPILILVIALLFALAIESQRIPDRHLPESPSPPSLASPPPFPRPDPPPPPRKPPAHKLNRNLGPPPQKGKTNEGKKIGLMFAGVASLLQVCIVAFLLISRRQLLKAQNGYQRN